MHHWFLRRSCPNLIYLRLRFQFVGVLVQQVVRFSDAFLYSKIAGAHEPFHANIENSTPSFVFFEI